MQTLEQERAAFALSKVEAVRTDERRAKLKTQLVKLPARLHSSGLGQTMAFYLSAGDAKAEAEICRWLEHWLKKRISGYDAKLSLMQCLTGSGLAAGIDAEAKYREASAEARALAVWLKRFAEAFLEGAVE